MSNAFGGQAVGTNYRGNNAQNPPNVTYHLDDPTQYNVFNFAVGDRWINNADPNNVRFWELGSKAGNSTSKGQLAHWYLIDVSGGGGDVNTLTGNTGTANPVAGNINVIASTTQGTSRTVGASDTITLSFSDSDGNTGIGTNALDNPTATAAVDNSAFGNESLMAVTTGDDNSALGAASLTAVTAGSRNTAIGALAGSTYTTETDNITIGYGVLGTAAESNTLRVGLATGAGDGELVAAYIAGIDGVNVGSTAKVVTMGTGGTVNKLGTAVLTAGANVTITPGANTITISATDGIGISTLNGNTGSATGSTVTISTTDGGTPVFTGAGSNLSLTFQRAGTGSIVIGSGASGEVAGSRNNIGMGTSALNLVTTGAQNVALGAAAFNHGNGSNNICIGYAAGIGYMGTESNNIVIGAVVGGTTGENDVIRIGATSTKCFISGIVGVTTDINDAIPVLIDSAGQLGTVSSSRKTKDNIVDMEDESSGIMNLRPVVFNFKKDASKSKQYGLIAEEVETHMPRLVVFDKNGEPETVKYHELPVLLLNEMQKMSERIDELLYRIEDLESEMH